MSALRRRRAWVTTALVTGLVLSACSSDDSGSSASTADDSVSRQTAKDFREQTDQQEAKQAAFNSLPTRPSGVVTVDGTTGSLTSTALRRYRSTSGISVNQDTNGEDRAFQRLCAGDIDIVDSSRQISSVEFDACREVGLDVMQFQVASDAVVLAIKSETDVGGDCLSTDQVRDVFRAGSPITNWEQAPVSLQSVPLEAGGPDPTNNAFGFFGRNVLDSAQPGLVDFRSDYRDFDSDDAARLFVAGDPQERLDAQDFPALQIKRDNQRNFLAGADVNLENALVQQKSARARKIKGERDNRSEKDKAEDRRLVNEANALVSQRRAERDAIFERFKRIRSNFLVARRAQKRFEGSIGNVAFFRFPYYGAYEDQLRPFEITLPNGELNCIFPSQRTIVNGEYPLSRQLLLTTTVRSLERREVKGFLDDYLSRSSVLAAQAGLVALPNQNIETQRSWITDDTPPTLESPDGQNEEVAVTPPQDVPEEKPAR